MFASNLLTGLAMGAGAMYFFDSAQGRRRRKLLADQFNHLACQCAHDFDAAFRDFTNRTRGVAAQAQGLMRADDAPDETIIQRVRSTMGHYVSTPGAIEVGCNLGHVVLRGPVLKSELPALMAAVSMVRGVRTVSDELTAVDEFASDSPITASPRNRAGLQRSFLGREWSPGTKLAMGALGGLLLANCLTSRNRGPVNLLLGFGGLGLLSQSLTVSQGSRRGLRSVEFHKTTEINAPLEKVFGFISDFRNLEMISDKVHDVRDHGNGVVSKSISVGGVGVRTVERFTCVKENGCIATESMPESMIRYTKQLNFERAGDNATRVHLKFCYDPPGGMFGHSAAAALGLDAKTFFDEIMMRTKTYLETGIQPHDAAKRMFGHSQAAPQHGTGGEQKRAAPMRAEAGTNAPPHDVAPAVAARDLGDESNHMGPPVERDLTSNVQVGQSEIRSHI